MITGKEEDAPITDEMFDVMSALVDMPPSDSWKKCKSTKNLEVRRLETCVVLFDAVAAPPGLPR
eukprot:COSAG01_NODE_4151_length_5283_cov_3.521371_7_plen_64_part_00